MCLIDFHSGHLSKGPEERTGIVITIFEGGTGGIHTAWNHKGEGIPWGWGEGSSGAGPGSAIHNITVKPDCCLTIQIFHVRGRTCLHSHAQ